MDDLINTREIMIAKNGKPIFAVRIDNLESKSDANYVYIENGDIKFSSSWLSSIIPFSLSNESHKIAKEIFTIGLQTAIKTKIMELKQLESIMKDINLGDCLGNVLIDNTKLLLEVNKNIDEKTKRIEDISKQHIEVMTASTDEKFDECIKEISKKTISKEDVKECLEDAIVENIKPIAVKKKKIKESVNEKL